MPAAFINLGGKDIFQQGGGGAQHLVRIPKVDELISGVGLALYTSCTLQLADTIQYFLTFDDTIKFVHFGKGLGTLNVEGMAFCTQDGELPAFQKFTAAFSALRGKPQVLNLGQKSISVLLTSAQFSFMSEPDTMASFAFSFSVVNHDL